MDGLFYIYIYNNIYIYILCSILGVIHKCYVIYIMTLVYMLSKYLLSILTINSVDRYASDPVGGGANLMSIKMVLTVPVSGNFQ